MGWKELLYVAGFLVLWIGLNRFVLPWFGIQTCMSGSCAMPPSAVRGSEPSAVWGPAGDDANDPDAIGREAPRQPEGDQP